MNYQDLVGMVTAYSNNNNPVFIANIPSFVLLAQQRIWREAKDIGFEQVTAQGAFVANNATVLKPANWNKTISFVYGTVDSAFENCTTLYLRTYEFCRMYWPNANKGVAENPPLFYADHQINLPDPDRTAYSGFFISPTPLVAYKYQIVYLKNVVAINGDNQENILTLKFPDLLFYACMIEAMTYLKDDKRLPIFENEYQRALQSINKLKNVIPIERAKEIRINKKQWALTISSYFIKLQLNLWRTLIIIIKYIFSFNILNKNKDER